ncbi:MULTISPECIES: carbohydrate ABC transporter permease [Metabacillus]|uniref:Carbohydrate ABC transporter permease n=1 Tax=Metabacillus hrfriensis TaxID=3048891 RepID=A0ACD4RA19_9BACI|nr:MULTISPECIES: carbohydrate ABC transporter permease [Metabacillus]UAL51789.1 carbohydrate ABC transporter permease [Metabacillus dongyingensis]USK28097.1 carbohydrate ABC transporter permease [Bacillus sp. CMF21]WHZ57303.1 carbohydrate ABC transporter permease [Metabacillus sp. CT-WN-B3]
MTNSSSDKVFNIVNYLLLAIITLLVLYPLYFVLSASVSDPLYVLRGEMWLLPKDINFDAYKKVFMNEDILNGFWNTIKYTAVGTAINVVMTTMAAFPLSRKDFMGRNLIMGFFVFTMFFSGGLIPSYLLIKELGMLDTFWVMVIPNAVAIWNIIIMRTFFQTTIPIELQESAMIDGCSNIQILIKIVLPLSMPVIAVMVLFYAVGHWNSYFNALIYLQDRELFPLQLILREILIQSQTDEMVKATSESFVKQQLSVEGLKYAVLVVSNIPMMLLYPFLQRYFVKGFMIGAIKG